MDEDVTVDGVRRWQDDSITIMFFEYIKGLIRGCDNAVHRNLMNPGTLQDAALENAALNQLMEVMNIPDNMVEDLKEKGENE